MLTDQERKLLQTAWSAGPSVLLNAGYTSSQIHAFFDRDDVQLEMSALDREFKHGAAFDARTRYATRKQLSQLSPGAVGLLAKAMAGPQFVRDPEGRIMRDARGYPILREAEISPAQLRAAEIVVDAVGGKDSKGTDYRGDVEINVLLTAGEKTVTIEHDAALKTPEQLALSRERMRNVLDRLLLKLPAVRERVQTALGVTKTVDVQAEKPKQLAPTPAPVRVIKKKKKPVSGG